VVRLLRIKKCEPRGVGFGRRPLLCGDKLLNFRPALIHQGSGTRADPFEVQIPTVGGACGRFQCAKVAHRRMLISPIEPLGAAVRKEPRSGH
jgi:hypothetical protein